MGRFLTLVKYIFQMLLGLNKLLKQPAKEQMPHSAETTVAQHSAAFSQKVLTWLNNVITNNNTLYYCQEVELQISVSAHFTNVSLFLKLCLSPVPPFKSVWLKQNTFTSIYKHITKHKRGQKPNQWNVHEVIFTLQLLLFSPCVNVMFCETM